MKKFDLIHDDCMNAMRSMGDSSIDLIVTDPPYFKVKNEEWDRRWGSSAEFLSWLGDVLAEFYRLLRPNGSLYVFASPQMSARVECLIAERFNVLNRITWAKPSGWHNGTCVEELRAFFPASESIVFAEHYGSDGIAKGESGYGTKCDELRGFVFEPLRAYLDGERQRAGRSSQECNEACGNQMAGHYFTRSQWALPTLDNYRKLRALFNDKGGDYLRREYDDLRREYDDLRREYDDLRREYDDLRRPFAVPNGGPHTDVWTFPVVQAYPGKHPCEKPVQMMRHIVTSSSRPGGVVLDPFMGSGATGVAAVETDREFIGVEMDDRYFESARLWIEQAAAQLLLFSETT